MPDTTTFGVVIVVSIIKGVSKLIIKGMIEQWECGE